MPQESHLLAKPSAARIPPSLASLPLMDVLPNTIYAREALFAYVSPSQRLTEQLRAIRVSDRGAKNALSTIQVQSTVAATMRTSVARRMNSKMKRSTASRCAFAVLIALPLLPVCGFVLNGSPMVVFFIGAIAFMIGVLLLVALPAVSSIPLAGSPAAARRFRFTIRDLLCLTTVLFGMTMFIVSGFRCEAAERSSRPDPLPAVAFRQFVWELESGLVCMTTGGLIWIRSALNAAMSDKHKSG